jgi:hypothetical protein
LENYFELKEEIDYNYFGKTTYRNYNSFLSKKILVTKSKRIV